MDTKIVLTIWKVSIQRITTIIELIILIPLAYYLLSAWGNISSYMPIIITIFILIIFEVMQKIEEKLFARWKVPELNLLEKRTVIISNFLFDGLSCVVAILLLFFLFEVILFRHIGIVFIGIILLIKWIIRWKQYQKNLFEESNKVVENGNEPG